MSRKSTALKESLLLIFLCLLTFPRNGFALGQAQYVQGTYTSGGFTIVQGKMAAAVYVDDHDYAGVVRAVNDLEADIARVTGCTPAIVHDEKGLGGNAIIAGTIGKSRLVDRLIREGKLDVTGIAGKWESFLI